MIGAKGQSSRVLGEFYGASAHLSRDKAAVKMGHPVSWLVEIYDPTHRDETAMNGAPERFGLGKDSQAGKRGGSDSAASAWLARLRCFSMLMRAWVGLWERIAR